MLQVLQELLQPMIEAKIDYLVLGCSHYPYLIPQLKKVLPENITIIDSGEAVARQTKTILANKGLLNPEAVPKTPVFYSNKDTQVLSDLIQAKQLNYEVNFLDF